MNRTDLQIRYPGAAGPRPEQRLPPYCRSGVRPSPAVQEMKRLLRRHELHSVCEEAACPNLNRCFGRGTATFMLLGSVCTRTCRFCKVATGRPAPLDPREPVRVSEVVRRLGLRHVVLTSVNRDDLPDGGAAHYARTVRSIRDHSPECAIEVLTPDFAGDHASVDTILGALPDVFNHNVETVPRLYGSVRPGARYRRSLDLLARVSKSRSAPLTKSGLMLGLGETTGEVLEVLRTLQSIGVHAITLGQYLRPSLRHLPVARYLAPAEFSSLGVKAKGLGFAHVASGPLVRSSFNADAVLVASGKHGAANVPL